MPQTAEQRCHHRRLSGKLPIVPRVTAIWAAIIAPAGFLTMLQNAYVSSWS
jgi:hypothetical protein